MALILEDTDPKTLEAGVSVQAQTMTLEKVFWSRFSPNLVPTAWVVGVLLPLIGLDFATGLLAIVVGNLLGSLPVALAALAGPKTGLTQMEASRFAFGKAGTRLPSFINWVSCVGWDAVNNVPSTLALVALVGLAGIALPFWLGLLILVVIEAIISIYGHDMVQATQKYTGALLFVAFAVTGILSLLQGGAITTAAAPIGIGTIILGIAIVCSTNLSWVPYASDYTRYLPRETSPRAIFGLSMLGLISSAAMLELFGMATIGSLTDPTPAAIMGRVTELTGAFAPVALFAIALSAVTNNSLNDNTASYSLISAGVKVSRPVAAVIVGVLGFILAAIGAGQYTTVYQNFLFVLSYWVAPWSAIVITHWFLGGPTITDRYPFGWTKAATIFVAVTVTTIALFASTTAYVGPVAKWLGGVDIGYFVGFAAAAFLYWITSRQESR
jgi:nucleobase:cation symporter-1, NCS1 family